MTHPYDNLAHAVRPGTYTRKHIASGGASAPGYIALPPRHVPFYHAVEAHEFGHLALADVTWNKHQELAKADRGNDPWLQATMDVLVNQFMGQDVTSLLPLDSAIPGTNRSDQALLYLRSWGLTCGPQVRESCSQLSSQDRSLLEKCWDKIGNENFDQLALALRAYFENGGEENAQKLAQELEVEPPPPVLGSGPPRADSLNGAFDDAVARATEKFLAEHPEIPYHLLDPFDEGFPTKAMPKARTKPGPMTELHLPLHRDQAAEGFRRYNRFYAGAFRQPQRALETSDGKAFGLRRIHARGGGMTATILFDLSGSMCITAGDIEELLRLAPFATVAGYSAELKHGYLGILARKGKICDVQAARKAFPGANVVDVPALVWLSRQPKPRLWICDGRVTGVDDIEAPEIRKYCEMVRKENSITRVGSVHAALDLLRTMHQKRGKSFEQAAVGC